MNGSRFESRIGGFGDGLATPPPRDLVILLVVVFVTFSLQFFGGTRILVELLRLTPLVWTTGFVWQLVTYPFAGIGPASFWFLLELLILFWFGRDVYRHLGRRRFWRLLVVTAGVSALVAVAVQLLLGGVLSATAPFVLMQGQRMLLTILIAAFATAYGHATILLFFVLPIKARWFLGLELLFAFMGFLGTHDLAGFVGLTTAVGITYATLTGRGPRRLLREARLRVERRFLEGRLKRMQKKRGFTVHEGGRGGSAGGGRPRDPWVH